MSMMIALDSKSNVDFLTQAPLPSHVVETRQSFTGIRLPVDAGALALGNGLASPKMKPEMTAGKSFNA